MIFFDCLVLVVLWCLYFRKTTLFYEYHEEDVMSCQDGIIILS